MKDKTGYDSTYPWLSTERSGESESRIAFVQGSKAEELGRDHEWDAMLRNETMLNMVVQPGEHIKLWIITACGLVV